MNNFSSLIENSKRAVRYWWLLLIIGIALFVVGILIFVYPTQSYLGMSLVFGWLMLFSGILEVVLSSANKHFITGRGWMLAGGIIEIILGIILIFNVALSAATLPIFLGFWLMLRGFSAIGLGGDMNAMEIPGSGWTVFSGILLVLCSLWILFQPLVFGTTAVVIWVGISLLFAGIAACSLSIQLRTAVSATADISARRQVCLTVQAPRSEGLFLFSAAAPGTLPSPNSDCHTKKVSHGKAI